MASTLGRMGEDGRYRVVRKLGEGGMAAVFLGHDDKLHGPVAIKVLSPEYTRRESVRRRFREEARQQSRLKHTNIVRALDWVESGDDLAIVVDFVDGPSLDELLAREGPLSLGRVTGLMLPLIEAVAAAHAAGVVHRDLKPANVLVETSATGAQVPRLTDFGIAKILGAAGDGRTISGAVMGTPAFMSPEQLRGQLDIDGRADIYSLGVMLYQLLTGRLPYGMGEEVPRRMAQGPPPPAPSLMAPGLPRHVDAIVGRAMALDRGQRYADVVALYRDVEAAHRGLPIAAARPLPSRPAPPTVLEETTSPPSLDEPLFVPRPAWQSPAVLFGALAGVLALALVAVVASSGSQSAGPSADRQAHPVVAASNVDGDGAAAAERRALEAELAAQKQRARVAEDERRRVEQEAARLEAEAERSRRVEEVRRAATASVSVTSPDRARPWLVLASSVPQSDAGSRGRALEYARTLRRQGFDGATVVDGSRLANFACCHWAVIIAQHYSSSAARSDVERLKAAGVRDAYAKKAW